MEEFTVDTHETIWLYDNTLEHIFTQRDARFWYTEPFYLRMELRWLSEHPETHEVLFARFPWNLVRTFLFESDVEEVDEPDTTVRLFKRISEAVLPFVVNPRGLQTDSFKKFDREWIETGSLCTSYTLQVNADIHPTTKQSLKHIRFNMRDFNDSSMAKKTCETIPGLMHAVFNFRSDRLDYPSDYAICHSALKYIGIEITSDIHDATATAYIGSFLKCLDAPRVEQIDIFIFSDLMVHGRSMRTFIRIQDILQWMRRFPLFKRVCIKQSGWRRSDTVYLNGFLKAYMKTIFVCVALASPFTIKRLRTRCQLVTLPADIVPLVYKMLT